MRPRWGWISASWRRNPFWPEAGTVEQCRAICERDGRAHHLTDDVEEGVQGTDFLYTDVWVSMGEPKGGWAESVNLMKPYQINAEVMKATGSPERQVHALPAGIPQRAH